jgi:dimethylamine/trimethylamine dehydrogenase
MECAIVLGKRGFRRVHLVDAGDDIGGIMRWVPQLPGRGEWARVLNWRRIQLAKLRNVEVLTGFRLDADGVREYGAEIVVVATGAHWAADGLNRETHEPIPGADASLPHVLTPEQVMVEGKSPPGKRVVVYDSDGYFMGPDLAERLAVEGFDVDLVTSLEDISPFSHETLEQIFLKERLHEVGVRMHRTVRLERVEAGGLALEDEFGEQVELEADAVVLVTQRLSDDALYHELRADEARLEAEGIEAVYRVGDCVAPQLIADCIFDGHRLAREIDSEDPAVPLPYVRERPVSALA